MASRRLSSRLLATSAANGGSGTTKCPQQLQNGPTSPLASVVARLRDSVTVSSAENMLPQMRRLHYRFTHYDRRNYSTNDENLQTHQDSSASLPHQPRQRRFSTQAGEEDGGSKDGGREVKKICYGKAKREHKPELVSLLCDSFVNREPIGVGIGVTKEDFMTWAPRVVEELTAQGFSVVAQDAQTGKVVGFFLNEVETLSGTSGMSYSHHWCKNEKMNIILKFLGELDDKANAFKEFQVDKLFRFQMVGVDANYGNLGIAKRLTDMSMETGIKESDCEVGVVECTGKFSQAIFCKYGFHSLAIMDYASYLLPNGESPFDLKKMGVHDNCKLMVKKLI